ncbi:Tetratricopeptide repeat-containing protein [Rhizobiales bacterium GAS188]|nr:Tetratricopeptide repeat-containing protein [Rhizobiales bacterium GAS188]
MAPEHDAGLSAAPQRLVSLPGSEAMIETSDRATDDGSQGAELEADHEALAGGVSGLALAAVAAESGIADSTATGSPASEDVKRLNASALAKFLAKDYSAAIELLVRVVNIDPDSPIAHGNLAVSMWRAKRTARAEAHCRRAIALDGRYVPAHRLLAEMLRERHDVDAALACYDRLFALEPDNAIAHNNAGLLLRKARRFDEAEAAFARARALLPDDPTIRFNQLSLPSNDAGLPEAIDCYRQSLEQRPDNAEILTNLAVTLQFSGRYDEAVDYSERAIAVDPEHRQAHFNLSLLLLLRGDYGRGWHEYEHRWRLPEVKKPNYRQPLWVGEDLDGKTILLQSEQGLGDSIQCLRYVPLIVARGGRVLLRLERILVRLAAGLPDQVVIMPTSARVPEFDVWCPLMSLPRIFGTRVDSIPAAMPYLGVRPAIAERWQRRLAGLQGLKVGLAWGGSMNHVNDARRSIDLQCLKPLLEIAGVSWVSLQVGPRTADLAALPAGTMTDLSAELSDFAETAGATLNLDLVIAIDTAVAHLAGALARPAWIMLPFSPDWRWLLERGDSPWYPTLRLYRQKTPGGWDDVVARLTADLAERVAAHAGDGAARIGERKSG